MQKGKFNNHKRFSFRGEHCGILLSICLVVIAFMSSCNDYSGNRNKSLTVFRYNESKGIASLDPAYSSNQSVIWPVNQLFNSLVQLDEKLNIIPCIAKSWEISEEGRCYRFLLRDDVYFHNHPVFEKGKGRKVVAEDFVYSLNRISDPSVASPGAWIFKILDRQSSNDFKGIKALNDSIFEIYLTESFPAFISILSMKYCSVVPHEAVEFYGKDFRRNPVGTGPFYLKLWVEDEKLVFRKNENYFEKDNDIPLPLTDAVAITFIKDKQSEFMEFIKGNIDFISGLNAGYKDELLNREGKLKSAYRNKFYLLTEPFLNTEYLAFMIDSNLSETGDNPLLIKKVRKAVNYGFDREKMMAYMRNNIGIPAGNGIIPVGLPGYNDSLRNYYYDPELALKLLSEAGFPNGEGLPEITLTTNSDYLDLSEYIQHQLSEIGIKIKIDIGTGPSFREMVANSKLPFFRASWIADYPDEQNFLALFYSKNFSPAGPNYTHFINPDFDKLYDKSMTETNASVRRSYYRSMDSLIMDEAVIVPLYYDQVVRFVSKRVSGLGSNPMNSLDMKRVIIDNN